MGAVTVPLQGGYTDHSSNVVGQLTAAQLATKYSGYTVKTATKSFTFPFQGQHVTFEKGRPVVCTAALVSALTAASAPVV